LTPASMSSLVIFERFRAAAMCNDVSPFYTQTDRQTDVVHTRSLIDRLISRDSSSSLNLVGDRAAHPVCDHKCSWQRHSAVVWIQLAPHLSESQLVATEQLSTALVDSVSLRPSSRWLGSSDGVEQR